MCFISDGYCTVQESKTIKKSRKAHRCDDCGNVIPIGSSYRSVFSVYEGDASTVKICDKCQSLRQGIVLVELAEGCHQNEAEPLLGAMFEQIAESEGAGDSHYLKRLVELGRHDDAAWLAEHCNIGQDEQEIHET